MSLALLAPVQPTEIRSIIPAVGTWAVYRSAKSQPRYLRASVQGWALVRRSDGSDEVLALIEGDRHGLDFLVDDDDVVGFWNEVTGERCHCGYVSSPYPTSPDPWWCRSCAGLIVLDA